MQETNQFWEESGLREAVLRGDEEAWRHLYDRCFDGLYAFVDFRTRHSQERTEEVLQESWMIAVRRMKSFDPARSSFESWLRGIALNVLRNAWRSQERRLGIDQPGELEETGGADPVPRVELKEQIGLAMTALPRRYQAVLRAKYEDDLAIAEIARKWGESLKAVESLLTRARGAFREAFARVEKER